MKKNNKNKSLKKINLKKNTLSKPNIGDKNILFNVINDAFTCHYFLSTVHVRMVTVGPELVGQDWLRKS